MTRLARVLLPPVAVTGLMIAAYAIAVHTAGASFFDINTWFKWDGGHYFSIARTGYEFRDCAGIPGFHPGQWCGNAGWFPGYPYFVAGLHLLTGADTRLLALWVSLVFALLSLMVVWNHFLDRKNLPLLLLCAFAPGTYYFLVIYPMSMTVCFMLLTLWAQREHEYALEFLAGAVVGFTYPSGVVFAGGLAAALAIEYLRGSRPPVRAWIAAAGPLLGLGMVMVVHQIATGHWNAFFLTQQKYKHGLNNPLSVLRERGALLWIRAPGWKASLQTLVATTLVVISARSIFNRQAQGSDRNVATHGVIYWLFPLVAGAGLSSYRAESLLVPAVTGLQKIPRLLLVLLFVLAIAIWIVMATAFAHGDLP